MGSWYSCLTTRTAELQRVRSFFAAAQFRSATAESGGSVVIAPEVTESFDESVATELAIGLSQYVSSPVLVVHVADDSVLWYRLCGPLGVLDEYNSAPDYFDLHAEHVPPRPPIGGNAAVLARAFERPEAESALLAALHASKLNGLTEEQFWEAVEANRAQELLCDSAVQRHASLCAALGLPSWCVEFGFKYISAGHLPDGLEAERVVFVGNVRPDALYEGRSVK